MSNKYANFEDETYLSYIAIHQFFPFQNTLHPLKCIFLTFVFIDQNILLSPEEFSSFGALSFLAFKLVLHRPSTILSSLFYILRKNIFHIGMNLENIGDGQCWNQISSQEVTNHQT